MRLAKRLSSKPRDVAAELADEMGRRLPEGAFETLEVAGPGFINMKVRGEGALCGR